MMILMSPTKTFNKNNVKALNKPMYLEEANYLINKIKNIKIDEFSHKFKISEKLAHQTLDFYQNISNDYAAVYLYGGTAFKYLDPLTLNQNQLEKIYILSGLFGILNAFDGISPYRLEISSLFLGNLYDYWENLVNTFLKTFNNDKMIIDLASSEYTKHIDITLANYIRIDFNEVKDNKTSSNSMMLKKYRGLMARYLVQNNISSIEDIKKINIDGFKFNELESSNNKLIFTKEH